MLFNFSRGAQAAGLLTIGFTLSACQTYSPRPLELQDHIHAWRDRSVHSDAAVTFVNELREKDDSEPVSFDLSDGLNLSEAELVAMVFNPDLRLTRLRAGLAEASAQYAGLWDDPSVSVDLLRVVQSVSNPWVIMPGLSVTLPISGRLDAEKQRANALEHVELTRVAEAEWNVRHELRQAWWSWSATSLKLDETRRVVDMLTSLVDATTHLADAGEIPRPEATLFRIELARLQQAVRNFETERVESEYRLRALMGLSPDAPLELDTARPNINRPDDAAAETFATRNLTLLRLEEVYEVAEKDLLLEVRKQYPDLTIGPLYEFDQGQSRIGLNASSPIPVLNANRQGIAESRVKRELARAEYETAYERMDSTLAMSQYRVATIQNQREAMERVLVPMVDQQLVDARQTLELGEAGGLVLLESLVLAYETKLDLIDLWLSEGEAVLEVKYLIGPKNPGRVREQQSTNDREQEVTP